MRLSLTLTLLTTVLLTGCVNESASYYVAGNSHALSIRGYQEYVWDEQLTLTLVASRLPECQRQIPLGQVDKGDLDVELFQRDGSDGFILRQGKQIWGVETTTCAEIKDAAKAALGARLGAFKMKDDKFVFEAAPQSPAPAAAPGTAPGDAGSAPVDAGSAVEAGGDAAPAAATDAPPPPDATAPAATPR